MRWECTNHLNTCADIRILAGRDCGGQDLATPTEGPRWPGSLFTSSRSSEVEEVSMAMRATLHPKTDSKDHIQGDESPSFDCGESVVEDRKLLWIQGRTQDILVFLISTVDKPAVAKRRPGSLG